MISLSGLTCWLSEILKGHAFIMEKFNLYKKLDLINEFWSPKIVGELNGQHVKLAKLQGEFVWHHHDEEDELFLVLDGRLLIQFRDGDVVMEAGDCLVIPRGVEHRPVAGEEVSILLFEPAGTINTGNIRSQHTQENLDRI
jgi:mannose-6-phosphate isomerase-like protein (cupin superfamily)